MFSWTANHPRIGWRWVRCLEVEGARAQCEVCQAESTGILHFILHEDYPDGRFVGPRCANILLRGQDGKDASDSERTLRQKAVWQRHMEGRPSIDITWSVTADGNDTATLETTRVIISHSASRAWAIAVIIGDDENLRFAPETYANREDAMEAATTLLLSRGIVRQNRVQTHGPTAHEDLMRRRA